MQSTSRRHAASPNIRMPFMLKTASLFIATASLLFATVAGATPMYKCKKDGTVAYQQTPCERPAAPNRKDPSLEELNANEKIRRAIATSTAKASPSQGSAPSPSAAQARFSCDGRKYCSQMTSCQEAKYFLKNCPGTKMDGDRDGIPCEEQWCSR